MNESELEKTPPTTLKELGIHVAYMRKDIADLKDLMAQLPNGFASVKDLAEVEIRVGKLENKQNFKNTLLWVGLVASAIINIVALYNIFTRGY